MQNSIIPKEPLATPGGGITHNVPSEPLQSPGMHNVPTEPLQHPFSPLAHGGGPLMGPGRSAHAPARWNPAEHNIPPYILR